MSSLYDELIKNITGDLNKTASVSEVKEGIMDLDNNQLITLAEELAKLAGDDDLAQMAKILPVYAATAHANVQQQISNEQTIDNANALVDMKEEGPSILASNESDDAEKLAEDDKEDKKEDEKKDSKEEDKDEKKDDKEKDDKEDKDEKKEDEKDEKSASEVLYNILKEGAALEELIEIRAAEMVDALVKEAFEMDQAREYLTGIMQQISTKPQEIIDGANKLMDQARTYAAKTTAPIGEAAVKVGTTVLQAAKAHPAGAFGAGAAIGAAGAGAAAMLANKANDPTDLTYADVVRHASNEELIAAIYKQAYEDIMGELAKEAGVGGAVTDLAETVALKGMYAKDALVGAGKGLADTAALKALYAQDALAAKAVGAKAAASAQAAAGKAAVAGKWAGLPVAGKAAVVAAPVGTVGATVALTHKDKDEQLQAVAAVFNYLDELDKTAEDLEAYYEKVAEEAGAVAEQVILQAGLAQGLQDPQLHEYVMKSIEQVKTIAAKKEVNLAQAAKMFLAGDTGSVVGVVEPIAPSPSMVPNPVKAPINSNQTQSPDQFVAQMAAPADPNIAAGLVAPAVPKGAEPPLDAVKTAFINEYMKGIIKQALLAEMAGE